MLNLNGNGQYPCSGMSSANPMSAFSALNLLRNYNQFLLPVDLSHRYQQLSNPRIPNDLSIVPGRSENILSACQLPPLSLQPATFAASQNVFNYPAPLSQLYPEQKESPTLLQRSLSSSSVNSSSSRRQRGEKKPIPDEQKDDKYYERRKRNNQAAKKSRDARKIREDQIALRASMLEHENAVLKAQLLTLREESASLRQMLLLKKSSEQLSQNLRLCQQS